MSQTHLAGRCFCGAVRYRVSGDTSDAFFCHCDSCRRSSGAPFVAWCRITEHDFEITQGALARYSSSPGTTWGFCARCGTGISYQKAERRPVMDFLVATLDSPAAVTPAYHIQTAEKLPWVRIDDGLPTYEGWRPKSGESGVS